MMIEIGALWKSISKKTGEEYWSGTFGGKGGKAILLMFRNKNKEGQSNRPDLLLFVGDRLTKDDLEREPAPLDDSIPF